MVNKKIGSLGKFIVLFGMIGGLTQVRGYYEEPTGSYDRPPYTGINPYDPGINPYDPGINPYDPKNSQETKRENQISREEFNKIIQKLFTNKKDMERLAEQIVGPKEENLNQKITPDTAFKSFEDNLKKIITQLTEQLGGNEERDNVDKPASEIIERNFLPTGVGPFGNFLPTGVGPFGANPSSLDSYQRRMMEALLKMPK